MSRYGIKDVFLTLQGEGLRAGTKALFVRFTGCNLWDGHPLHRDRGEGSCARWCDTDFFKGTVMDADTLLGKMDDLWPLEKGVERWCVLTGGEPTLQIDRELVDALRHSGWRIAIETNGTEENNALLYADHICIAPKLLVNGEPTQIVQPRAHEIKVVLPGALPGEVGWTDAMLDELEARFSDTGTPCAFFVQPQDPLVDPAFVSETALLRVKGVEEEREAELEAQLRKNIQRCIKHVMRRPQWRLSFQVHKLIGLQ